MIRLRVESSADPSCVGRTFTITADRARIGRGPDNDVLIEDAGLSRHHASLVRTTTGYTLVDEGSANGIWIGEARVGSVVLGNEVRVRMGGTVLVLEDSRAASTIMLASPPPAPVAAPPPRVAAKKGLGAGAIVGIVAGGIVALAIGVFFLVPGVPRWLGETIRGESSSAAPATTSSSSSTAPASTKPDAPKPAPAAPAATGTDEGKPALLEVADVREGRSLAIDGSKGGEIVLSNGARLGVAAGSYAGTQTLRLVRTAARTLAKGRGLVGDVYIVAADDDTTPTKPVRLELPIDRDLHLDRATKLGAYAMLADGSPYVVPSTLDAERDVIVIENPAVHVLGMRTHRDLEDAEPVPTPKPTDLTTGYTLGPIEAAPPPTCVTGAAGEIHETPGHVARVHAGVATSCEHMREVSSIIQEAYVDYQNEFKKDGKAPFDGWLAVDDRMDVTIGSTTAEFPEGEYNPFWGGGVMSVASVMASREANYGEELRITLYHEMFHALQDIYTTMAASKVAGRMWWMESTAEWAGRKYGRTSSTTTLMQDLIAYGLRAEHGSPYVLRLPIDHSRKWHKGYASYHYAMLIEHVEQQSPGYVKKALHGDDAVSGTLLESMYTSGKIDTSYAAFLGDNATAITPLVQLDGKIMDTKTQTRVWRAAGGGLDTKLAEPPETFSKWEDRYKTHSFKATMAPATARFFQIRANPDGKPDVTLSIGVHKAGTMVDTAVLIANGTSRRVLASWDNRITHLPTADTVWLIVYRPWVPGESREPVEYTVSLTLYIDCPRPGGITIGGRGVRRGRDPHRECLARNGYKPTYPPPLGTLVMVDIPPTG